jgi:hypothetical protein
MQGALVRDYPVVRAAATQAARLKDRRVLS